MVDSIRYGFAVQTALDNEGFLMKDWAIELGFFVAADVKHYRLAILRELHRAYSVFLPELYQSESGPKSWQDDPELIELNEKLQAYESEPLISCLPTLNQIVQDTCEEAEVFARIYSIPTLMAMLIGREDEVEYSPPVQLPPGTRGEPQFDCYPPGHMG